ncbi:hypothetical protein NL108_014842, partial [Boleophthalmus pectinirostris]
TLLEYAGHWQIEDEPLPVVQVYMVALQSYAETSAYLSVECDNVQLVVERLALSFVELLLSLKELPDDLWNDIRSCVQVSHGKLQENGITQLSMLWTLGRQMGVWTNPILQGLLSGEEVGTMQIENWLVEEGPGLLELRVKQLIKDQQLEKAAQLAKICSESASCNGKANFKQMYLVCLCTTLEQDQLMEEARLYFYLNKVDCRDALEMICNLESDGDEKAAFTLCSAFLTRQLLHADAYCAWELTLFWSKLLKRLESSEKAFLDKCGQMSLLSKTVYHILFLIKVIQSEITEGGVPVCIEMCIRALRMPSEDGNTKATVCKTIACLLPNDLEVKRACQLTVFLLDPTVDSFYAVETLYNEPDQKIEEEKMTVPNSLRCELLLVFKTQWPFDPEFWDWKTLKRHCLARMGPEASIVSSIDSLNDTDDPEEEEDMYIDDGFLESADRIVSGTYELTETMDKKQKNREQKKLREKGFISARFRNWQVYMQYCVLCDKEFLGHRIIRHAQTHFSRGEYSCPICAQSFSSKDTLTPHVTSHVKQSCKDRLTAMKTNRKLANPKTAAPVIAAIMARTESEVSKSGGQLGQIAGGVQNVKARLSVERGEEHVCPVGTCKKTFKFYRNLLSHVRSHNENEEAISYLEMQSKKVVCQYCRRHFVNVNHLNDHLQVHCGAKPYICIQLNCKASFLSNTELLIHRKTHTSFKARCMFPNCGKIFNEAFKLYDHEAKHYKTFTCKFVDCGKVFHTQQQLDLHFKSHTVKKEQEVSAPDENLQTPQTSSSVNMAQSISDPPPLKEADNATEKCRAETVSVGKPETLENLLKASQTPIKTVDRYEINTENEEKCFVSEASQIVNVQIPSQPENGCCTKEASQSQSPDLLKPPPQYQKQHVSPFEATINKMLREKTVLHSQLQVFSSNVNSVIINHNELPVSNAAKPALPPTQPIPAPIVAKLQAVPPAVATPSVNQKESAQTETVLRERYHCPFENCTRNYSCYKSVSKHIKTTHPELYAIRRIPRSEIRVTYVSGSPLAPKPVTVKTQDNQKIEIQRPQVIQPTPYSNMVANYNAVRFPQPVTVNQTAPQLMENVLNPIVVAQLKTNVHHQTQKILPKAPQQEQVQNLRTSTLNVPRPPEFINASLVSKGLVESHPTITVTNSISLSNIQLPPNQIKPQDARAVWSAQLQSQQLSSNQLHPTRLLPSGHMSMPEENCNFSSFSMQKDSPENTTKNDTVQNPSCQPPENLNTPDNNSENRKTVRKRNKVRWPAIVRDGKWFCSRCYRAFNSSKSLGGHLSKRLACKPYDEMELNADLPASFLDLLNSDQTVIQQNHTNIPCDTFNNRPHISKSHGLLEQKGSTSQKYQERLNGETSNDILKQIVKASNIVDPFIPSHTPQIQKPCVSTATNFQSGSVKQSMDGVGRDVGSSNIPNYSQPRPPGRRYPTPLLSQALKNSKEFPSVKASSSQQEIDSKDQATVLGVVPQLMHPKSSATTNIMQPERCNMEQDIKKKLREQILAGDFQRRNNLVNVCHNSGAQSPMSCGSESSSKNEDCQMNWDVKGCFASKESTVIIPGTPAEIEELLKTKSFTCLRPNTKRDMQSSTSVDLNQDVDTEPQQLSPSQQQCFSELKIAFEKMNLIRESPEPIPEPVTLNTGLNSSSTSSEVTPDDSLAVPKLFVCDAENCAYNTFSSEAYWRHLYKVHNYTFEQVNAVKKQHGQYAPFQCQRCNKTFTRNPNLKAHYISAHQLSFEEIHQLDMKRKQDRAAMVRLITLHNGGAKKKRPSSVGHQELVHQKPSNPGCTSVIQALPKTNFHNLTVKQEEHVRTPTEEHTTNGHQRTATNGPVSNGCQSVIAHLPQGDVPYQAKGLLTPGKQSNRPATVKPSNDLIKKIDKKSTSSDTLSPYKPYRCVHQDCEAAFAIQHNLILHYRAIHQSALSALEVNKEQDQNEADGVMDQEEEEEEPSISEFRCQVKDCSRVFQQVPQLMQHYLRLHEFSIDKVGDLLSIIRLGKFTCGHEGCAVSFTAFWKYIAHVKELHKDIKLSKPENMYKCEIEGCDRAYATKSNMLRHLMKKHNDFYQLKQKNQPKPEDVVKQNSKKEYQLNKTSDGKENIESNQTSQQKDSNAKRTRKINNYWTKYEKPVLKSNVEASAMCTKSYPLQYPCMIKGCESVMNSEKSILKHYTVHGLSEKFLEQHRSHYIFCKKFPRQKNGSVRSDDSKSDPSSDSEPELTSLNGTEEMHFDDSKPFLRKRTSPIIPASLLDGLSNDDSSDGSVVMKRKRGRPKRIVEKIVKRKKMSQPPKVSESRDECSNSSVILSEKESDQSMSLAAFKPMGFEMSFLKFLEQSNKTQPSLSCEIPLIGPWVRLSQLNTKETYVKFSNRQNMKTLDKVKIVMDKAFLGVTELMLKQLQEMQPLVILEKI